MTALRSCLFTILLLLATAIGQQRSTGTSRSLTSTRETLSNYQWIFARNRAKMQDTRSSLANRRLVRADTNAGPRPITFGAPGVSNRNTEQAIGFGGNGNSPASEDRPSQPQGEGSPPISPLFPTVSGTREVASSSPEGIIDPVPDGEAAIIPIADVNFSPPAGSDQDISTIPQGVSNDPVSLGQKGEVVPPSSSMSDGSRSPSVSVSGGGSAGGNTNQPKDANSSPNNKRLQFRTRENPRCSNNSIALPCERDSDYNDEIAERVRAILRDSRMNAIIENNAVSDLLEDSALVKDKTFSGGPNTRMGADFVSETPACRAQESIIYPQRAKTTLDDWVFVINQDTVKQGVRVEKCIREGQSCDLGVGQTPTIRTTCRQKFIYRKLLVLSGSGSDVQSESVLIPSCCVCYIRKIEELVTGRIFNGSLPASGSPAMMDYAK